MSKGFADWLADIGKCSMLSLVVTFAALVLAGCTILAPLQNQLDSGGIYDGEWDISEGSDRVGTLFIKDSSYTFYPVSGIEIAPWMLKRFSFLRNHHGTITISHCGAHPEDSVDDLKDHAIVATCQFDGQGEQFYIRLDKEQKRLHFHAMISEFQLYEISKSYKT